MKRAFSLLFPAQFLTFRTNWSEALGHTSFKRQVVFTLIILAIIVVFISRFFNYIQSVPGHSMDDFILNKFQARNMSLYIFLLIYFVILLAVINLSANPFLFLKCIQAYCLLVGIRIFCMYFFPLEPEQSIIPLQDPLVGKLFYNDSVITKDLFFSGHVSTMSLLALAIPFRSLKYFFIAATLLVGIFILVQHVHYTIDVLAAPVFSWICYSLTKFFPLVASQSLD